MGKSILRAFLKDPLLKKKAVEILNLIRNKL